MILENVRRCSLSAHTDTIEVLVLESAEFEHPEICATAACHMVHPVCPPRARAIPSTPHLPPQLQSSARSAQQLRLAPAVVQVPPSTQEVQPAPVKTVDNRRLHLSQEVANPQCVPFASLVCSTRMPPLQSQALVVVESPRGRSRMTTTQVSDGASALSPSSACAWPGAAKVSVSEDSHQPISLFPDDTGNWHVLQDTHLNDILDCGKHYSYYRLASTTTQPQVLDDCVRLLLLTLGSLVHKPIGLHQVYL
jgi:hypothetical protein